MSARTSTSPLTAWSCAAYSLILQAYPYSFRREFGPSMAQVFTDSVRDAWRAAGITGLAILWMKTGRDVVVSLARAYAAELRNPLFRRAASAIVLYAAALIGVVSIGALAFGEFYRAPAFSAFGAPQVPEDALLAAYDAALTGRFGSYRLFAAASGLTLAILLGVAAALFGRAQHNLWHGALGLVAGSVATVAALELMPAIWFPLDRYPVGALWMMGGGLPVAALTWAIVTGATAFGSRVR
jgi:hypothetical protein